MSTDRADFQEFISELLAYIALSKEWDETWESLTERGEEGTDRDYYMERSGIFERSQAHEDRLFKAWQALVA